ncbi:MAG: hypothetical protein EA362_00100 [Saprospirales bacterium]|nr:MAG: hypothetical protein EA362_00100 [Saprospirales bacterium]
MSKFLFLFTGFVVLSVSVNFAQTDCPVNNYFSHIYAAENHLVEGNHEESKRYYYKAFDSEEEERIIFIKDLHNALMLAYQTGDAGYFGKFIYYLNQYDVDSSFFETVGYEELKESIFYTIVRSFLENKEPRHFNSAVCSTFNRLRMLDQSIRRACNDFFSGSYYHFCGKEIALLDSLVLLQLKEYFYEFGLPKESEFCNVTRYYTPPYRIIIRHNLQWCRLELLDFIKGEVGRIHPQVLADILQYNYNNPCDGSETTDPLGMGYQLRLDNSLYIMNPPEDRIDFINESRSVIYLDSIEDSHRKIKFQEFNPEYSLVHNFLTPQISADPQRIDALKERFKDIKVKQKE